MLLKPCLSGKGAIDLDLSQESCGRPSGHRALGFSHPGACAGPLLSQSTLLLPSDFSMSSTVLTSNLHICWYTVCCSPCSSEDRLDIPPVSKGKWTLLPPILPASSKTGYLFILLIFSLAVQKLFILMRSHLFILSLMFHALGNILVKILMHRTYETFLPMFSSSNLMVS